MDEKDYYFRCLMLFKSYKYVYEAYGDIYWFFQAKQELKNASEHRVRFYINGYC